MRNVTLVLEDGTKFHGKSFGYEKPVAGVYIKAFTERFGFDCLRTSQLQKTIS